MNCIAQQPIHAEVDLDLVAQRVLKLAEIAMLDHLESLERSQLASALAAIQPESPRPWICPEL